MIGNRNKIVKFLLATMVISSFCVSSIPESGIPESKFAKSLYQFYEFLQAIEIPNMVQQMEQLGDDQEAQVEFARTYKTAPRERWIKVMNILKEIQQQITSVNKTVELDKLNAEVRHLFNGGPDVRDIQWKVPFALLNEMTKYEQQAKMDLYAEHLLPIFATDKIITENRFAIAQVETNLRVYEYNKMMEKASAAAAGNQIDLKSEPNEVESDVAEEVTQQETTSSKKKRRHKKKKGGTQQVQEPAQTSIDEVEPQTATIGATETTASLVDAQMEEKTQVDMSQSAQVIMGLQVLAENEEALQALKQLLHKYGFDRLDNLYGAPTQGGSSSSSGATGSATIPTGEINMQPAEPEEQNQQEPMQSPNNPAKSKNAIRKQKRKAAAERAASASEAQPEGSARFQMVFKTNDDSYTKVMHDIDLELSTLCWKYLFCGAAGLNTARVKRDPKRFDFDIFFHRHIVSLKSRYSDILEDLSFDHKAYMEDLTAWTSDMANHYRRVDNEIWRLVDFFVQKPDVIPIQLIVDDDLEANCLFLSRQNGDKIEFMLEEDNLNPNTPRVVSFSVKGERFLGSIYSKYSAGYLNYRINMHQITCGDCEVERFKSSFAGLITLFIAEIPDPYRAFFKDMLDLGGLHLQLPGVIIKDRLEQMAALVDIDSPISVENIVIQ